MPGDTAIGVRTYHYTSTNGFSWQASSANPVFREGTPGSWDSGHIETPSVAIASDEFWLYYSATPDSMADDGTLLKIGLATSPDGETWLRNPTNPILEKGSSGSWEERQIESPSVVKTDSLFYMWYSGVDIEWKIHVGLATSVDGVLWEKYTGNPVFSPLRESDWDSVGVYAPQVRWLDDRFVMLYTGLVFSDTGYDYTNLNTGVAVSEDGIHWTRASDQPVLSGTPGSWDVSGPFVPDWIETGEQLLMAYTSDGHLGMATSPIDIVHVDLDGSERPEDYVLLQNYPNPFNPATTIQYRVPMPTHVTLGIYNLKGREVQTLVDEVQHPGIREIEWDGKNKQGSRVGTGLYVIQMVAGEFVRSKKIVLIR